MGQINFRISNETADAFRLYCRENGVTQNEGFAALLLEVKPHAGSTKAKNVLLEKLQQYKQSSKTAKNNKENASPGRCRQKDWTKAVQSMLNYMIIPDDSYDKIFPPIMKIGRFKNDSERLNFHNYCYPEGVGCMVVCLDSMFYSSSVSPAVFVLGHHGNELVKFRWYFNDNFLGKSLRDNEYAYAGAIWLMGYVPAPDGASTLIVALPVERIKGNEKLCKEVNALCEIKNLDATIADAKKCRDRQIKWI